MGFRSFTEPADEFPRSADNLSCSCHSGGYLLTAAFVIAVTAPYKGRGNAYPTNRSIVATCTAENVRESPVIQELPSVHLLRVIRLSAQKGV
jgi:hypothetical protein